MVLLSYVTLILHQLYYIYQLLPVTTLTDKKILQILFIFL